MDDRRPSCPRREVTLHHDMLSFVLSIRTSKVTAILACFSAKKGAASVFKDSSKHSLVLLIIRKQDKLIDQWQTPLGIARFATQDMSMVAQIIMRIREHKVRVRCAT